MTFGNTLNAKMKIIMKNMDLNSKQYGMRSSLDGNDEKNAGLASALRVERFSTFPQVVNAIDLPTIDIEEQVVTPNKPMSN